MLKVEKIVEKLFYRVGLSKVYHLEPLTLSFKKVILPRRKDKN